MGDGKVYVAILAGCYILSLHYSFYLAKSFLYCSRKDRLSFFHPFPFLLRLQLLVSVDLCVRFEAHVCVPRVRLIAERATWRWVYDCSASDPASAAYRCHLRVNPPHSPDPALRPRSTLRTAPRRHPAAGTRATRTWTPRSISDWLGRALGSHWFYVFSCACRLPTDIAIQSTWWRDRTVYDLCCGLWNFPKSAHLP